MPLIPKPNQTLPNDYRPIALQDNTKTSITMPIEPVVAPKKLRKGVDAQNKIDSKQNIDQQYALKSQNEANKNWLNDSATRTLSAVKTLGASAVGDAIQGISPDVAQKVSDYTWGLISPTSNEDILTGRYGSNLDRANIGADAISSVMGAELMGEGINKLGNKITSHFTNNPFKEIEHIGTTDNPLKSIQDDYIKEISDYYESPQFNEIMDKNFPQVNKELYKQKTLSNLTSEIKISDIPEQQIGKLPGGTIPDGVYHAYPTGEYSSLAERIDDPLKLDAVNKAKYVLDKDGIINKDYIGNSFIKDFNKDLAEHELGHQRTNSDQYLPKWLNQGFLENNFKGGLGRRYFSDPSEFDSRLGALKRDLRRTGIVDHFNKPIKLEHVQELDNMTKRVETEEFKNYISKARKFQEPYINGEKSMDSKEYRDFIDDYYKRIENDNHIVKQPHVSKGSRELMGSFNHEFISKMARSYPVAAVVPFVIPQENK